MEVQRILINRSLHQLTIFQEVIEHFNKHTHLKLKELTPPGGGPSEANRIKSKGERRHADSINLSGLKI